nr:MAK10-like protein [Tanacetum cinerariifolium]
DANPIRTLEDYSKPSHEGYRNTIELPVENNAVPIRSNTIQLVQNECSFHGLRSEDPNQHLKDFLKLVDSLDLDGENKERTRLIHHHMVGSYYSFPCSILSTRKDHKIPQQYPDVPTTSRRISFKRMDSFQGLTPKSPSSWYRSLAPSPNLL